MAAEFNIVIVDDRGRRTVTPATLGELTVGRDAKNHIRLAERNVSRQHMRVARDGDAVFVEDLNSYNGVWVNGERIAGRFELGRGDEIRVGDFRLEIQGDALKPRKAPPAPAALEPTQPNFQ